MIPPIPARRRNHRRGGVPTAIPHNRLPHPAAPIVIIPIHEPLIALRPRAFRSLEDIDRLARFRAVEIPDVDLAVVRAGVNVATVGGSGWREVAANEGFEDAVATESDEGAVVRVRVVVFGVVGAEAVVEVGRVVLRDKTSVFDGRKRRGVVDLGLPVGLSSRPGLYLSSSANPTACTSDPCRSK